MHSVTRLGQLAEIGDTATSCDYPQKSPCEESADAVSVTACTPPANDEAEGDSSTSFSVSDSGTLVKHTENSQSPGNRTKASQCALPTTSAFRRHLVKRTPLNRVDCMCCNAGWRSANTITTTEVTDPAEKILFCVLDRPVTVSSYQVVEVSTVDQSIRVHSVVQLFSLNCDSARSGGADDPNDGQWMEPAMCSKHCTVNGGIRASSRKEAVFVSRSAIKVERQIRLSDVLDGDDYTFTEQRHHTNLGFDSEPSSSVDPTAAAAPRDVAGPHNGLLISPVRVRTKWEISRLDGVVQVKETVLVMLSRSINCRAASGFDPVVSSVAEPSGQVSPIVYEEAMKVDGRLLEICRSAAVGGCSDGGIVALFQKPAAKCFALRESRLYQLESDSC